MFMSENAKECVSVSCFVISNIQFIRIAEYFSLDRALFVLQNVCLSLNVFVFVSVYVLLSVCLSAKAFSCHTFYPIWIKFGLHSIITNSEMIFS